MELNTEIIYQKNSTGKLRLFRKKKHMNYIIITKKNVFLFDNQDTHNQVSNQLLKKIIPFIEEEFLKWQHFF